ncbi:AAA family ATPase [Rhizobium gallicum]|uniref:AAA family ATPase n=1 Tax=Rhizobium gallicum TaxID=56730 RepID=UPI003B8A8D3F
MTDEDVAFLLRSDLALVTIEAPAGCGKTFQGANFALDAASSLSAGRVLILTHTHAARSVFANRTRRLLDRVEIRTIDSFLTEIAAMYHRTLNLPLDVGSWARENSAYDVVAARCKELLECSGNVSRAAALRYPIIVCDEHQDASADQHAAIMAIHRAGSRVRFLGELDADHLRRRGGSNFSGSKAVGRPQKRRGMGEFG